MGETIPFPDNSYAKMSAEACDELASWVAKYLEAGMEETAIVGLLEVYKLAVAYNLLEDVE